MKSSLYILLMVSFLMAAPSFAQAPSSTTTGTTTVTTGEGTRPSVRANSSDCPTCGISASGSGHGSSSGSSGGNGSSSGSGTVHVTTTTQTRGMGMSGMGGMGGTGATSSGMGSTTGGYGSGSASTGGGSYPQSAPPGYAAGLADGYAPAGGSGGSTASGTRSVTITPYGESHIVTVNEPCPSLSSDEEITKWRAAVVKIMADKSAIKNLSANVEKCFPTKIPACIGRVSSFYGRQGFGFRRSYEDNYSDTTELKDADAKTNPRRQVPKELLVSGSDDMNYVFRPDAEEVAKKMGWPVVRYKSRHSGGFDRDTSSLVMIEVPGKSLHPPTNYDRYINIALPKDDVNDGTEPVPSKPIPSEADYKNMTKDFPTITTIVSVERATSTKASQVYFQLFQREKSDSAAYQPQDMRSGTTSCFHCHPNGLREISPLGYSVDAGEKQLPPDAWKMVKRINDDMRDGQGDAPADFGTLVNSKTGKTTAAIDTDRYGPMIGPSEPLTRDVKKDMNGKDMVSFPTRSEEFILGKEVTTKDSDGKETTERVGGCASANPEIDVRDIFGRAAGAKNIYKFTSSPPVNWTKIADAMDCQSCHDGGRRNPITSATEWALVEYKILVDKNMPHHAHRSPMENGGPNALVTDELNLNERIALVNCLQSEFDKERDASPQWLTEIPCKENSRSPSAKRANELLNKLREKSCGPTGPVPASVGH